MKKFFLLLLILSFTLTKTNAQAKVNTYKYVIVPLQYKFLKGQNAYRLNTLTKQLFLKSGYEVYYDNQLLPDDVFEDRCLAMYVDVNEVDKGFRLTNLEIELKDCRGKLILKSDLGTSGINMHEERYQTALRNAYETVNDRLFYQENSKLYSSESETVIADVQNEIEETVNTNVVATSNKKMKTTKESKIDDKLESSTKLTEDNTDKEETPMIVFYAKKIENGFQLVNQERKTEMVLLNTALDNVFLVKGGDAIVFKKEGDWILSKNGKDGVQVVSLNIKF
ncbi:hypothetical protein [Winogradskyella alexanderae]|uniref:Secreted protein n=1 Tax=Winogradskyella alexanderae TaxID=2877123 RepID=A0ABS7XW30_9FLAO|nr:hypothetical protein [Winogradskyella alexanderae]MCA0133614.1 hypothetical protein [Winogradskyella alexanderae]